MKNGVPMEQMTTHQFYTGCAMIGLLANPSSTKTRPDLAILARNYAWDAVEMDEEAATKRKPQEDRT